jgi:hypothetical protein
MRRIAFLAVPVAGLMAACGGGTTETVVYPESPEEMTPASYSSPEASPSPDVEIEREYETPSGEVEIETEYDD